jgi:hypothetical protein
LRYRRKRKGHENFLSRCNKIISSSVVRDGIRSRNEMRKNEEVIL